MKFGMYYVPDGLGIARRLGAACGHAAYAAAVSVPLVIACEFFDGLKQGKSWVGMRDMEKALSAGAVKFYPVGRDRLPKDNGLILIQWEGPWPPRANPCFRHWAAFRNGMIFDINFEEWISEDKWKELLREHLWPKRATGWHVSMSYEVIRVNL